MQHILEIDRNQMQFMALEEVVGQDPWARVVDEFVDLLLMEKLDFKNAQLQKKADLLMILEYF